MAYSDDAAEQVVKMALEGTEFAARITGEGAKHAAMLIYAVLKDQHRTKGKTRLNTLLQTGKELKVFAIRDKDLELFCRQAKMYGVLYCVLKDKNANDGLSEIMVKAEDASKINRIFERNKLSTVDMNMVQDEIRHASEKRNMDDPEPVRPSGRKTNVDQLIDALLKKPEPEVHKEPPFSARTGNERPSEVSFKAFSGTDDRPSIHKMIQGIREEMASESAVPHISPEKLRFKGKER